MKNTGNDINSYRKKETSIKMENDFQNQDIILVHFYIAFKELKHSK